MLRFKRPLAFSTLFFFSINVVSANLAFAQSITTDGRTETTLAVNGNVTDIATQTVSGPDAFNAFGTFGVDQGNVVNLMLPDGTYNLINLVDSGTSVINGTLNSVASGQVGGHVYFLNPSGIVIGASGVVNVGSLTALGREARTGRHAEARVGGPRRRPRHPRGGSSRRPLRLSADAPSPRPKRARRGRRSGGRHRRASHWTRTPSCSR